MPILSIDAVEDAQRPLPQDLSRALADATGQVLGTPPGRTWVCLRRIPATDYGENHCDTPPAPLLVSLRLRRLPPLGERPALVQALTQAIARAAQRAPEQVHLLLEPAASGHQAFGGELVP